MSGKTQRRWWVPNLRDAFVIGGIVLVASGAAWIYPPAGLIAGGLLISALGYWGA